MSLPTVPLPCESSVIPGVAAVIEKERSGMVAFQASINVQSSASLRIPYSYSGRHVGHLKRDHLGRVVTFISTVPIVPTFGASLLPPESTR